MKNLLIYTLLLISTVSFAQNRQDRGGRMDHERMKAAKIAFLTDKLDLNSETAQEFWPIYNEYEASKESIGKEFAVKAKDIMGSENVERGTRNFENISDEHARELLTIMHERKKAELMLEEKYLDKFLAVLNPKQVLTVYQFDAEFRRTLMKRFSEQSRKKRTENGQGN